jgi:hypothetical protein
MIRYWGRLRHSRALREKTVNEEERDRERERERESVCVCVHEHTHTHIRTHTHTHNDLLFDDAFEHVITVCFINEV